MTKNTSARVAQKQFFSPKKWGSSAKRIVWHALGLGADNRRDPAALTFARMGLLASRW